MSDMRAYSCHSLAHAGFACLARSRQAGSERHACALSDPCAEVLACVRTSASQTNEPNHGVREPSTSRVHEAVLACVRTSAPHRKHRTTERASGQVDGTVR